MHQNNGLIWRNKKFFSETNKRSKSKLIYVTNVYPYLIYYLGILLKPKRSLNDQGSNVYPFRSSWNVTWNYLEEMNHFVIPMTTPYFVRCLLHCRIFLIQYCYQVYPSLYKLSAKKKFIIFWIYICRWRETLYFYFFLINLFTNF